MCGLPIFVVCLFVCGLPVCLFSVPCCVLIVQCFDKCVCVCTVSLCLVILVFSTSPQHLICGHCKQDNLIQLHIDVPMKYHRHFVARRFEVIHGIMDEYSGVNISFPPNGVDSEQVVLKGPEEHVKAARKKMTDIVADLVSSVLTWNTGFRFVFSS